MIIKKQKFFDEFKKLILIKSSFLFLPNLNPIVRSMANCQLQLNVPWKEGVVRCHRPKS